jgi:signal transduction histidine kinase/DNA-binding LacI/PurR family transcriptional regulator
VPRPVVGVLQRDPLGLYAEQWLGGVDAAGAHGCDLICFFGRSPGEQGFWKQANAIYDLVTEQTLDGLVVWATALGYHFEPERMTLFCRRFNRLPMVTVEQVVDDAPAVLMAEREGMAEAVSHLIEVHGHRRIAFVRGVLTHTGAQRRYQGYLDALARHGIPVRPELVSAPLAYPEAVAGPVAGLLRSAPRPEAIVTAHDDFAMVILSTLRAAGVRTPEDIAVVGFDDRVDLLLSGALDSPGAPDDLYLDVGPPGSGLNALALTTVRAPFQEMGRLAVAAALGLIRGEKIPQVIEIPTELVIRRTCGCQPDAPVDSPAGHHLDRLRAALPDRSTQLPGDWAQRLSDAFLAGIRDGSDRDFRAVLDQLVPLSVWSGERVEHWWRVLAMLRQLAHDAAPGRAEELLQYAKTLLTGTTERYWRYRHVLGEKRSQVVREVGYQLVTAPDVAGVAEVLTRELPKLGISRCYLAEYQTGPAGRPYPARADPAAAGARARLLLAYEHGVPVDLASDAAVFPSVRLVPGDRLRGPTPSSLVTVPLYFRDQQLGFVLFEIGPRIGWVYTTLQEQLSSALHRARLIESDRAAMAAVEEVHRRAERHRLAEELHDSISQALFSMTLHTRALQLVVQQNGGDPDGRLARGLADLRDLTQTALAETRALILQMRPESLQEEGLVVTLRRHAATVAAREGLDFRFEAPDRLLALDERAEEELFRVVQEALHNSVKHARAQRIELHIWLPGDLAGTLVVEITDDGTGFDPDLARPGHLGLHIMRERVERIGGQLIVDSAPSRSTTIRAVVPGVLVQEPG